MSISKVLLAFGGFQLPIPCIPSLLKRLYFQIHGNKREGETSLNAVQDDGRRGVSVKQKRTELNFWQYMFELTIWRLNATLPALLLRRDLDDNRYGTPPGDC